MAHQQGMSKTGLSSARVRDLDVAAPRPKLPPRARPEDVRAKLGLVCGSSPSVSAASGGGGGIDGSAGGGSSTAGASAGAGGSQLQLKGLVDPAAEAEKLQKRIGNIEKGLERLVAKMAAPLYAEKVPAEVREADAENAAAQRGQLDVLLARKAKYESWAAAPRA